jgi:hypothetical protein
MLGCVYSTKLHYLRLSARNKQLQHCHSFVPGCHLPSSLARFASVNMLMCYMPSVEDSLGDGESDTMERLRDVQVRLDATRHEHYTGSQR